MSKKLFWKNLNLFGQIFKNFSPTRAFFPDSRLFPTSRVFPRGGNYPQNFAEIEWFLHMLVYFLCLIMEQPSFFYFRKWFFFMDGNEIHDFTHFRTFLRISSLEIFVQIICFFTGFFDIIRIRLFFRGLFYSH